jgi:hypothetical protein
MTASGFNVAGAGAMTIASSTATVVIDDALSVNGNATALAFYGDGSNLTGISTASNWIDVGDDVSTSGNATVDGALFVGGGASLIEGDGTEVTIDDDLIVTGDLTIGNVLTTVGETAYYKGVEIGTGSGSGLENVEDTANGAKVTGDLTIDTSISTSAYFVELTLPLGEGMEFRVPYIKGSGYSSDTDVYPNPTAVAMSDGLYLLDDSGNDYVDINGVNPDFSSYYGIRLDFATQSAQFGGNVVPDPSLYAEDTFFDLGASGLEWQDLYLSGDATMNGSLTVGDTIFGFGDAVIVEGDLSVQSDDTESGAFYFGDLSENGSWRIIKSGNNLAFQRLESAVWTTKQTISA